MLRGKLRLLARVICKGQKHTPTEGSHRLHAAINQQILSQHVR